MFIDFFYHLRAHQLPVSLSEYLTLLDALRQPVMPTRVEDFYRLARLILIKDESLYDKYDRAFAQFYEQHQMKLEADPDASQIPLDWLIKNFERHLSAEERAAIQKHGWDKLMELFKERLAEQTERHAGGNKWIGTGGSSPFGHGGYHPEGIRVGGPSAGHRTAVKVWEEREFKDYDDQQELGTRNFKMALRRLRRFARAGQHTELDLEGTIRHTAHNAGLLDIQMRAERHNAVKVLMLLDVGGSMDDHIALVQELFSAARSEFKHLHAYYFHNCPYEGLWTHNHRRHQERIPTLDVLHRYGDDWTVIFVGDATMSPYEIMMPGGSVEHYNDETGAVWIQRMLDQWPHAAWLNPEPHRYWSYHQSILTIQKLMDGRMYDLSLQGLESAMQNLAR